MSEFLVVLSVFGIFCSGVAAFIVFHGCRYFLNRLNWQRDEEGKKLFSPKVIFVLSLLAALSFVI